MHGQTLLDRAEIWATRSLQTVYRGALAYRLVWNGLHCAILTFRRALNQTGRRLCCNFNHRPCQNHLIGLGLQSRSFTHLGQRLGRSDRQSTSLHTRRPIQRKSVFSPHVSLLQVWRCRGPLRCNNRKCPA